MTSHAIAEEPGYAAGTFYLHFKDKQQLFREIAAETVSALRVRLDAAIYLGIASRFLLLAVNHYVVRALAALRWPFTALLGRRVSKRRIARRRAATKLLSFPESSLESR